MKYLLCLSVALLLVGCASPAKDQKLAQAENKQVVCHREKPPGLLRTVTVCRDVEHIKEMEKSAKAFMEDRREGKWEE